MINDIVKQNALQTLILEVYLIVEGENRARSASNLNHYSNRRHVSCNSNINDMSIYGPADNQSNVGFGRNNDNTGWGENSDGVRQSHQNHIRTVGDQEIQTKTVPGV